jgi:hypothetical protein
MREIKSSGKVQDDIDQHADHGLGRYSYLLDFADLPADMAHLFLPLRLHLAVHSALRLFLFPVEPSVPAFQEMLRAGQGHFLEDFNNKPKAALPISSG